MPKPSVIILDEVDRISDSDTTTLLADTIKNLSDHALPATLILIGVADSVNDLIREHRSTERALVQVHLPRMSYQELREVLVKGANETGVGFEDQAAHYIVKLSAGLPHYTHMLAQYAAENAVDNGRMVVAKDDVDVAIKAITDKPGSLLNTYEQATQSSRPALYAQVLLACALAEKSELGYFSAVSVRNPLEKITGIRYEIPAFSSHLEAMCRENRGKVLRKDGAPRLFRYRFVNPLLQPFVVIQGLAKNLLPPDVLAMYQDDSTTVPMF